MRKSTFKIAPLLILALGSQFISAQVNAQPLTPIPGSPFSFGPGANSNVTLLSPDETHLFVTEQVTNTVTVLNVAPDGSLSYHGTYSPSGFPVGMTTNSSGTILYVVGNGVITVFSVAADGTLSTIQTRTIAVQSNAESGIVYVSQGGGDFLYVNTEAYFPNMVAAFAVNGDGTLGAESDYSTEQFGYPGFFASPSAVTCAASGGRLYVVNRVSSNISAFNIASDGSLSQVTGSPFALPLGDYATGALAIEPAGTSLYAGTNQGHIVKFDIDSNGSLTSLGAFGTGACNTAVDGMSVTPDGAFIVATLPGNTNFIGVLHSATMRPVVGSPILADPTPYGGPGGVVFNKAGTRIYVGNFNCCSTVVSVYQFSPQPDFIDTTPPTTMANLYRGPCYVTVNLGVFDPEPCDSITTYYILDGGPTETYLQVFDVVSPGSHTLEFWSVDSAGNEETPHNSTTFAIVDTQPPTTTAYLNGAASNNGWYRGAVSIYLQASDPDSCQITTYFQLDGGATQTYYGGFAVSGDGSHKVEYWSVDGAGNEELPHQKVTFGIDTIPPTITETVTVAKVKGVWAATASGKITDPLSGTDPSTATYKVYDEYGQITPGGSLTLKADGSYSYKVTLGPPNAGDRDGRRFEFVVTARDLAGNAGSRTVIVSVTNK